MTTIKNRNDLITNPIQSRPGFYILCLSRSIPKIKENDKKGILYIGKSINLANRLVILIREQWKIKLRKQSIHTFDHSALTFAVDFSDNGDLIPSSQLIKSGIIENDDTIYLHVFYEENYGEKEKQLLAAHIFTYGQLPPFNSHGSSLKAIGEGDSTSIESACLYFNEICQTL